jgi:RNA polymerase-binding protein DksA
VQSAASQRKERGFVVAKAASKRTLTKAKSAGRSKPAHKPRAVKSAKTGKPSRPAEVAKKPGSAGRVVPALVGPKPGGNNEAANAASVPTNSKPRKNLAGFNARELEHFRDLLLGKRGEILGDVSAMEREALRTSGGSNLSTLPIHMADMGTDNYEQEFTLTLVETDRKLLREINHALAKIQNGSFGICEGTGKPITKARLEAQPWARYSIEYAKRMERGGR